MSTTIFNLSFINYLSNSLIGYVILFHILWYTYNGYLFDYLFDLGYLTDIFDNKMTE